MHELTMPHEATDDDKTVEILRVWTRAQKQGFASRPDVWSDPAAWGLLLVDIARQVARGYCEEHGGDPETVLRRIKAGFDAEWAVPTDP